MTAQLPSWLVPARDVYLERRARRASTEVASLEPGQIRLVHHMDGRFPPRLALLLDVDESIGIVEAALVSNEVEMASDSDLILGQGGSGGDLPFGVIIESDIAVPFFAVQCTKLVGSVGEEVLAEITRARQQEVVRVDIERSGPPVLRSSDIRWQFKKAELREAHQLAGDAAAWIFEGVGLRVVDPLLLASSPDDGDAVLDWSALAQDDFTVPTDVFDAFSTAGSWLGSETASPDLDWLRLDALQRSALDASSPETQDAREPVDVDLSEQSSGILPVDRALEAVATCAFRLGQRAVLLGSARRFLRGPARVQVDDSTIQFTTTGGRRAA